MDTYERPILSRYLDPIEVVWYATAKRLGLHIRRDPSIFSRTDGTGLLALGPLNTLDPDDCTAQMIFHEICHWITNGLESFHLRDWGFPLDSNTDWREHAGLRLQAHLAGQYGLRQVLAPTSGYREYYDSLPQDILLPLEGRPEEDKIVALTAEVLERAKQAPWAAPLHAALLATAQMRATLQDFIPDYATDQAEDTLPSLWMR